jgi:hypothetical protein
METSAVVLVALSFVALILVGLRTAVAKRMSPILTITAVTLVALVYPVQAQTKAEKEAAVLKYKDKFLVVKKEGLYLGVVGEGMCRPGMGGSSVANFIEDAERSKVWDGLRCGTEPIHKGEVLKIYDVHVVKAGSGADKGPHLSLIVGNVSPHSITRGIGAFAHQSVERGATNMLIRAGNGKDFNADAVTELTEQWFMRFDNQAAVDAARLGNTETGVFVNQVKLGMSFAEVEKQLGVPQTRVDLGEKVLYKYKDMTVEFHDSKVTDVR